MLVVLLVTNTQLVRPHTMDQAALNWLVVAAGVSIVGILLFPWYRYNRNLFLVATCQREPTDVGTLGRPTRLREIPQQL